MTIKCLPFIIDLRRRFEDADEDSSGNIDKKEFKKMLRSMGHYPGDKEFDVMFKEIDQDSKNHLSIWYSIWYDDNITCCQLNLSFCMARKLHSQVLSNTAKLSSRVLILSSRILHLVLLSTSILELTLWFFGRVFIRDCKVHCVRKLLFHERGSQRRIQNAVKHVRWSLSPKYFTAFSRELFFKTHHFKCLTRFWIRLWFFSNLKFAISQAPKLSTEDFD